MPKGGKKKSHIPQPLQCFRLYGVCRPCNEHIKIKKQKSGENKNVFPPAFSTVAKRKKFPRYDTFYIDVQRGDGGFHLNSGVLTCQLNCSFKIN